MHQFEYQYPGAEATPIVTCIVPEKWLALDLPFIGGAVSYRGERGQGGIYSDFLCI